MVADTDREAQRQMLSDPNLIVQLRLQELRAETARDRLADQVPQSHSSVRHGLASACVRLADWLDDVADDAPGEFDGEDYGSHHRSDRNGYVRHSDSGPSDWVAGSLNV